MKVGVVFNAPVLAVDHPDFESEADVVRVAEAVASVLRSENLDAVAVPAAPPIPELCSTLSCFDLAFNLAEGFAGVASGEARLTALLELLGLPYTGCPPEAQSLCLHKGRAKALLRGFGLPTADFVVALPGDLIARPGGGAVIVKPAGEDGSLGIDQGSVVGPGEDLEARIARVRSAYGPAVLVEAYLPGPEYNVGLAGLPDWVALPVAEVIFDPKPGDWPILTYAAKWDAGGLEDLATRPRCPARIDVGLAEELGRLAVLAARATGCRDVARVDFRLDDRDRPMILEVNPNPDLGPSAGWARALSASGRDYAVTMAGMARRAFERGTAL